MRNTYSGFFFIALKPWSERKRPEEQVAGIQARLNRELGRLPQGVAFSFSPPAIQGIGTSGGVTFMLEDRAGKDVGFLAENTQKFVAAARKRPELARVTTTLLPSVPQVFVDVDRDKVLSEGVDLAEVYRDAPDVHGRAVRQLLQPVRPPVAGVCRRRRGSTGRMPPSSASSTCATATATPCRCRR